MVDRVNAVMRELLDFEYEPAAEITFDRYAMYIWRALLRISAQQHPHSGHVALDSTLFERNQASQYYLRRVAVASERSKRRR